MANHFNLGDAVQIISGEDSGRIGEIYLTVDDCTVSVTYNRSEVWGRPNYITERFSVESLRKV